MDSQNSKFYWNKMTLFANLQETNKIIVKERTSNMKIIIQIENEA
jgi:hypothetical protein